MLLTNSFKSDFLNEVKFFQQKMLSRGHSEEVFDEIAQKFEHAQRRDILDGRSPASPGRDETTVCDESRRCEWCFRAIAAMSPLCEWCL